MRPLPLGLLACCVLGLACAVSPARAEICPRGAGAPVEPRRPVSELPEGDLAALDAAGRQRALDLLNAAPCLCGCRHTLASCRVQASGCERSRTLAAEVARLVGEGRPDSEVQTFLRTQPILPRPFTPSTPSPPAGPDSPRPAGTPDARGETAGPVTAAPVPAPVLGERLYEIPLRDAATRGPDSAPVTIVEFIDFRCPFCARSQPLLQQVMQLYPGQVRLVFKHYPLPSHAPFAEEAALAALAAQRQDGDAFWKMHDRLFSGTARPDREALVELARELGLDVDRFRRDRDDPQLKARLEADLRDGKSAEITGTPMFYVNGRKLLRVSLGGFQQAIEQALAAGGAAKP